MPKIRTRQKRTWMDAPYTPTGYILLLVALTFVLLGAQYQPWRNDWEIVRTFYGEEEMESPYGAWNIGKAAVLGPEDQLIGEPLQGRVTFLSGGKLQLDLLRANLGVSAAGKCTISGNTVLVTEMKSIQVTGHGQGTLPKSFRMQLSWQTPDFMVAEVISQPAQHELLYLTRIKDN
jgi:hypothetical protein